MSVADVKIDQFDYSVDQRDYNEGKVLQPEDSTSSLVRFSSKRTEKLNELIQKQPATPFDFFHVFSRWWRGAGSVQ